MLLSKGSVKLRSLGLSSFVLAMSVGLMGAASTGCFFVDDHDHGQDDYYDDNNNGEVPDQTNPEITEVAIQPDQILEAAPGKGVGIFVEYRVGGKWHVWTTCDTFVSKSVCSFDIFAEVQRPDALRSYAADEIEGFDSVKDFGDGTIELTIDTDSDVDGMVLDIDEGEPLSLEVYLDGESAEPFVYWVSNDVLHEGAPNNPILFRPQAP